MLSVTTLMVMGSATLATQDTHQNEKSLVGLQRNTPPMGIRTGMTWQY
jgi:hypothetical protein